MREHGKEDQRGRAGTQHTPLQRFLQVACATGEIKDVLRSLAQDLNTFTSELAETEPHGSSRPYRNEMPQPQQLMAVDLGPVVKVPGPRPA